MSWLSAFGIVIVAAWLCRAVWRLRRAEKEMKRHREEWGE